MVLHSSFDQIRGWIPGTTIYGRFKLMVQIVALVRVRKYVGNAVRLL